MGLRPGLMDEDQKRAYLSRYRDGARYADSDLLWLGGDMPPLMLDKPDKPKRSISTWGHPSTDEQGRHDLFMESNLKTDPGYDLVRWDEEGRDPDRSPRFTEWTGGAIGGYIHVDRLDDPYASCGDHMLDDRQTDAALAVLRPRIDKQRTRLESYWKRYGSKVRFV